MPVPPTSIGELQALVQQMAGTADVNGAAAAVPDTPTASAAPVSGQIREASKNMRRAFGDNNESHPLHHPIQMTGIPGRFSCHEDSEMFSVSPAFPSTAVNRCAKGGSRLIGIVNGMSASASGFRRSAVGFHFVAGHLGGGRLYWPVTGRG